MLFVLLGLIAGIWIDDWLQLTFSIWLGIAASCGALWLLLWWTKFEIATLPLLALVIAAGGIRYQTERFKIAESDLGKFAPSAPAPIALEAIALTGARITIPPESTPLDFAPQRPQTHVLISVQRVRDGQGWRPASGKAWLRVMGKLEAIGAGDQLRIFGEYSRRESRGNPGEPDLSRQMQLEGTQFSLRSESPSQVQILQRGSVYSIARWIGFQRQAWIAKLHRKLGEKQGSLAAAILLGAREQLDRPRMDAFLLVGMSHILVVSGANVAILAGVLLWLQRVFSLPRGITLCGIGIFVIWFALLADGEAPVARAAAAMLVLLVAQLASRRVDSVQVWSAAGAAVLLLNPAFLFSLGAQLSFLSVATLIQAAASHEPPRRVTDSMDRLLFQSRPFFSRWLIQLGEMLWEALRTSIWVWLTTLPLLWSTFGFTQWGSILLNPLLTLPFVVTLYSGMLFLVTDGIVPGVAPLMSAICWGSLEVMEWLVERFQNFTAPTVLAPPPPTWWVVLFYVGVGAVFGIFPGGRNRSLLAPEVSSTPSIVSSAWRRPILATGALLWLMLGGLLGQMGDRDSAGSDELLKLTFLNVGHGTCILMEFPGGETWVYDAGSQSDGRGTARTLWEALLAAKKSHVDRMIISHDDTDHYSALPTFLRRVRVRQIVWSKDFTPPRSHAGKYLIQSILLARTPTAIIDATTQWEVHGVKLRVIHPSSEETFGSDNSRSVVLEIEYAGKRVLLPGDLETPGLELVMSRDAEPYEVVMAPHHGSERSIPARFAGWSRPRYVVISGDEEDRLDSTIDAYASGGAEVFHTADEGAVVVTISKQGELKVRRFRDTK